MPRLRVSSAILSNSIISDGSNSISSMTASLMTVFFAAPAMIIDYRSWAKKIAKNWAGVSSPAIAPGRRPLLRGVAAGRQVGRGGRSPEAAEASGCSWRVGNRFISPILLEIFSGYAAFPSFLGQLVQLLGLCGIKFHLLCWSILEGCPIRRADHDIQSALSGLRIAKVPAKPGAPGSGPRFAAFPIRA